MPNWVGNVIKFNSLEDAKKVWEGMQVTFKVGNKIEKRFSYSAVIAPPKTKEECMERYLITEESHVRPEEGREWFDWYSWNCDNWGVKWDACDPYFNEENMEICFDSPWGKPYNDVFSEIAVKFDVSFTTAHHNEDGGWEELDYYWEPDGTFSEEVSQWQADENEEERREYEEEMAEYENEED